MAEEETSSGATSAKVKFLCSHGGKILPRPSDGELKYVGGETRVICVPRTIAFSDLIEKISSMFEGDFILKYQIGSEELDALVSVKSDEDLHHMLDEYERLERAGVSKLRAFLFPAKLTLSEIHSPVYPAPESLEQRFVDALNGVVRPINVRPSSSRLKSMSASASECTSPRSPSPRAHYSSMNFESAPFSSGGFTRINRVRSSPSLVSLVNHNPQQSNGPNIQNVRPYYYQTHHQHHHQQQYHSGHHPFGKQLEHHLPRDGFGRVLSTSNLAPASHQSSAAHSGQFCKGCPGSGGHNRWAHLGKPPAAYGEGSARTANVSPSRRGAIWE